MPAIGHKSGSVLAGAGSAREPRLRHAPVSAAPPAPTPSARDRPSPPPPYWNVTGNDWVLLATFFSPGTGTTVAVTVCVPVGGTEFKVTCPVAC